MSVESPTEVMPLRQRFTQGLEAPICLTWELTYACNLACVHCLSSSGRRDPMELTPAEARQIVDELADMKVFYVNIGGGEPMLRPDFFDLVGYAVEHKVGVKFSTNGTRLTAERARRLAAMDYVDVQISIDGALASTNDAVRGEGSFAAARTAMDNLAAANFGQFKISVVVTRENVTQLDSFSAIAESYGAQLRLTRFRPSGRGVETWDALHPTAEQQRMLYHWLLERPDVLTGDSFFHLSALGQPLDGLNLCGAGRVVCLIDPVGDVYACPFVIDKEFLAGNVRDEGGFAGVWRQSDLFRSLHEPHSAGACASCGSYDACQGGCMAAKFFTGIPLDGPDPECVFGHGEEALAARDAHALPGAAIGHSKVDRHGALIPVPTPVRFRLPRPPQRGQAPSTVELGGATWPDVEATKKSRLLVLPIGSLEQHGPHLPLDTDTRITVELGRRLSHARPDVVVAPPVPYGASGEHAGFAGTLLVDHTVLAGFLVELIRSARASFSGVVLISAHGGNNEALSLVRRRCRADGEAVVIWTAAVSGGDAHAGRTETSLMLAIDPAVVRMERSEAGCTDPLDVLMPRLRAEGVRPVSSNGVLGDPRGANAAEGELMLAAMVDDLVRALDARVPDAGAAQVSRIAVVSGAGRGIGAATVDRLVSRGWHVVAVDVCTDDPSLAYPMATPAELAEVGARHGDQVRTLVGDVRSRTDMQHAVGTAVTAFGGLDAAIAVAGVVAGGGPLWDIDDAQWHVQFDVNVHGVRNLVAAAVPVLLEAPAPRQGRVVAVASAAGLLGLRRLSGYSASKHAVIGLIKSLAADLAGTGVTANAVCPGSTRTPILDASAAIYDLASAEEFAQQQLVERLLVPAEPAALIAWLCEAEASGVTGAALPVDGGLTTS